MEACFYGMDAIFNHNTSSSLHHKQVIKDLKGHQFYVDKITLIKLKDSNHCDVIAKDDKGFRSYKVTLEKNAKYDHLYKIFDVKGQKLTSSYQYEGVR